VAVALITVLAAAAVAVGTGAQPAVAAGPDYLGLVANANGNSVSVVNTNTMLVTKTITGPVGMEFVDPRGVAITPDGTKALVTNFDVSYVSVITMSTLTVTSIINLSTGSNGTQLGAIPVAITPDGATALVSSFDSNSVVPIALSTLTAGNKVTTSRPNGIAITADGTTAYVSNSTATGGFTPITISGAGVLALGTTVNVACVGARGVSVLPNGATLYLGCQNADTLIPIALPSGSPGTPIAIGDGPVGVAASPNGTYVYVGNYNGNNVTRLTVASGVVTAFAPYDRAHGVAVAPDSGTVLVTKSVYAQIQSLVEPAGTSTQTTVGAYPYAAAITPDQAPVASFTATTAVVGAATTFNAAASTVAYGTIARYDWDFGDGTTLANGGPTPSHTYANIGSYTATVTETSSAGTSTTKTFTGQTVSNNGGPSATTARTVTVTGEANDPLALVVNNASNTVTVVNARTLATLKTITGPTGMLFAAPTAVAITPDGTRALVGNDTANYVSVITMSSLTVTSTINLGTGTTGGKAIAITPDGTTALVTNKTLNTVTPITGLSGTPVVGTPVSLGTGAGPFNIVITPDGATAYIANTTSGTLVPFTVATRTLGTAINLQATTACTEPRGLAITPNGATLYVTCQSSARVKPVNLSTKAVGAAITVGATAVGIAITPDGASAYVTTNGALTRIIVASNTPNTYTDAAFGVTHNAAVTPDGASVIFPKYASPGAVFNLNVAAGTTTTTAGANNPYHVAITPDQAPVASFTAPAVTLGSPTSFNAWASTVAFGTIASYFWNFGDGVTRTTATPTTTYTYANPGSYTATVTATSSAGTSTTDVFTGQTMSRNGGPTAVATRTVTVNDTLGWTATPGDIGFSLTLNGQTQTTTATMPLKVAGGISTLGWSISATSTRFTSGPHTLPSTAVTVQTAPTRSCDSTCTLATTSVSYPYTLPAGAAAPAATKIYNATANTGMGSQTVTPTFTLTIPATTRAGTYTSTWTYTLSSGP
jgi:YVTN family beta-propeller protein